MVETPRQYTIHELARSDVDRLRDLLHVFGTAFDDLPSYVGDQPDDDYLRSLLAGDTCIVLVAEAKGKLVGGLAAYELKKFEQMRSEIYIYDLAVSEDQRRAGVATALIERLQQIAAERGAWVIFVQADHGDDPAIALYTKLGAREDVLHFDIPPKRRNE